MIKHRLLTPSQRRRGSVFILVLAVLATLLILAISFSYTSRLEYMAARNWANGVQARSAAVSGIPLYNASNDAQGGIVSPKAMIQGKSTIVSAQENVFTNATGNSTARSSRSMMSAASGSLTNNSALNTAQSQDSSFTPREPELKEINLRLRPANANAALQIDLYGTGNSFGAQVKSASGTGFGTGSGKSSTLNTESTANSTALASHQDVSQDAAAQMAEQTPYDPAGLINLNALVPVSMSALKQARGHFQSTQSSENETAQPPFLSEDVLATLIQQVVSARHLDGVNAQQLAHAIALRRFGPDALPGRGGYDDDKDTRDREAQRARELNLADQDYTASLKEDPALHDRIDNNLNGQVDEQSDGVDDLRECLSDPRARPNGDDQPYASLSELLAVPGMTQQLYDSIAPFVTVFSASYEAFALPQDAADAAGSQRGDIGWPRLDPNTASAESIYKTLAHRFPKADPALLAQFTVNMIDRRDADDVPTTMMVNGENFTGIELTPYINEVCPDVSSLDEKGDNGQFLELYNPYQQSINLAGWTLRGAGTQVTLDGSLPPEGFLVITDDYNDQNDQEFQQQGIENGSFFTVFHVAAGGPKRQVKEVQGFSLPNDQGSVKLVNPQGQVVDEFTWQNGKYNGQNLSFQRIDPRLRRSWRSPATPLAANAKASLDDTARQALKIQQDWQNKPFRSGLDVMLVSSAFAQPSGTSVQTQSSLDQVNSSTGQTGTQLLSGSSAYAMPVLSSSGTDQLDVRLVDCFRVGVVLRDPSQKDEFLTNNASKSAASISQSQLATLADVSQEEARTPDCAIECGGINLNTAPLAILSVLPGMTPQILTGIAETRLGLVLNSAGNHRTVTPQMQSRQMQNQQFWQPGSPFNAPVWANLSDFLLDENIWQQRPLYDRLDAAYSFLPLLVTHSQSLAIGTANRSPDAKMERQPSTARAERIMAFDRNVLETLSFKYAGLAMSGMGDSDLRLSNPATKPVFNEGQMILQASEQFRSQRQPISSQPGLPQSQAPKKLSMQIGQARRIGR